MANIEPGHIVRTSHGLTRVVSVSGNILRTSAGNYDVSAVRVVTNDAVDAYDPLKYDSDYHFSHNIKPGDHIKDRSGQAHKVQSVSSTSIRVNNQGHGFHPAYVYKHKPGGQGEWQDPQVKRGKLRSATDAGYSLGEAIAARAVRTRGDPKRGGGFYQRGASRRIHEDSADAYAMSPTGARNIGRGLMMPQKQAKEHGIKPGDLVRDRTGGTHEVSHVNGTTINTTQGKMFHSSKVDKVK